MRHNALRWLAKQSACHTVAEYTADVVLWKIDSVGDGCESGLAGYRDGAGHVEVIDGSERETFSVLQKAVVSSDIPALRL